MKKFYALIMMVAVMVVLTSSAASAGSSKPTIKVTVNNETVKYDVKPYVKDGKVMIPVKRTSEALGATVEWDKKNKTVWVNLDMMHIELTVGKSEFYIHRDADFSGIPETVKLDTPITIVKGKVMVPGRKFLESLGMTVSWDNEKRILSITNDNSTGCDLSNIVTYTEITESDISEIKDVHQWYTDNNKKRGISYIRDGEYIYALIGAGEKPTGGFTIEIDNIFYSTADTVTINASVNPPGDNVRVMMVITYPAMLIRIDADSIKAVVGDVVDAKTSTKEQWITMDSSTITQMELINLDQEKIKDITGTEKDAIVKSFNEATIDPNPFIEMITGSILKVIINDGYVVTFTSYGSETNVIVSLVKDGEARTFHLIAPVIAKTLLNSVSLNQ